MAVAAAEGVEELVGLSWLLVVAFLDDKGGLQFRKEVQILQGLPSGPRTIPGGRVGARVPLLLIVI
jgi:hypothetical protein